MYDLRFETSSGTEGNLLKMKEIKRTLCAFVVVLIMVHTSWVDSNESYAIVYKNRVIMADETNRSIILDQIVREKAFEEMMTGQKVNVLNNRRKRRSLAEEFVQNKIGSYEDFTIVRPTCVPLKSSNINANPYHPSLLSIPGTEIRTGNGDPIVLENFDSVDCPVGPNNCELVLSKSTSMTVSESFSITVGETKETNLQIGKGLIKYNKKTFLFLE